MIAVKVAGTDWEIESCYPIMAQLRPHLTFANFVTVVRAQMESGYWLAYLTDDEGVAAIAGFRITRNLACGNFLYVDDLVTDAKKRSKGYGRSLLKWLFEEAHKNNCVQVHLDSGIQRRNAHRFYKREGMELAQYHFVIEL